MSQWKIEAVVPLDYTQMHYTQMHYTRCLSQSLVSQYLLHFLLALSRWVDEEVWHKSHVTKLSWALLQDSFHTSLCLRESPEVVATAVLYLAVQCCKLTVPCSEEAKRQWWEVFSPHCSEEKLQQIATDIMRCVNEVNKNTVT